MDLNFIESWRSIAVDTYRVDPVIFIALMLISTPFYYYGLFEIGRVIFGLRKKHKLSSKNVIRDKIFIRGLIVYEVAWALPYIYIVFWGDNIPIWVWIFVSLNLLLGIFLFYTKIKKQIHE